ncbi:DUF1641 domain-containing protein [Halocatena marina]|uniref:DUF1641 domain-containing protein n=1 Tax=Halocatena marina TaxID=2934937 RepID=UPI00200F108F|nr:DUF1641 domain-containing protein [Halocatena marina]
MAKPQKSYPETATNGAREPEGDTLHAVLADHDNDLASILSTDEVNNLLTTVVLIAASADESDLDHITESTATLIEAADGLTTAETAELAENVGANAAELSTVLETVLQLEREGHLDDLVTITTAFTDALSPSEVAELADTVEAGGTDLAETLDLLLDLQRGGHLEDLIDIVKPLSALEVEPETVDGLNTILGAVGAAQNESQPTGFLGLLGSFKQRDVRAGLGYLASFLAALGRRVR